MNHIFHYYVTAFLALKAGFSREEAEILSYASQYVDNALIPYRVIDNGSYDVANTHHFGFWSHEQEDSIWIPFHFFPSGESVSIVRKDGLESPLAVLPNSKPVIELLTMAFRTKNLYRIGIALHTFADSWAHQNFSGRREEFNRVPGSIQIPPVGHAQVESAPDIFHIKWTDTRLHDSRIDNRSRFMEASRYIYRYLAEYQKKEVEDIDSVMSELEQLLGVVVSEKDGHAPSGMISSQIRKRIHSAGTKARNLADRFFSLEQKSDRLVFTDSFPILCGPDDSELEERFLRRTGLPPYDRRKWRRQAFIDDRNFMEDTLNNSSLNDKISWIQHEVFSRSGLRVPELVAREGFFTSHLFEWSEAAYAHRQEARVIIRNVF